MDLSKYLGKTGENPLDNIPADGGFCGIFRTIGCIGDSLSSGEFETRDKEGKPGYHDLYEYSWGQYIARMTGSKVYNFSRGGMTGEEYWNSFADINDFWSEDKLCQCYILALGVNEILCQNKEIGTIEDIDFDDYKNNKDNFAGYYSRIIQRLKTMQPDAKFFLMTMARGDDNPVKEQQKQDHAKLLYEMAERFDNTYVIDLYKYGPTYDAQFRKNFYLLGHMNPMGYMLTAKMVAAYIDYIIRNNMEDFKHVGFIGTDIQYKI